MILVLKIPLFVYVVIKIIEYIVKIITLLCDICNNCFVNIVGIENLTTCIDSKFDLCLQKIIPQKREIANFGKILPIIPPAPMNQPDLHPWHNIQSDSEKGQLTDNQNFLHILFVRLLKKSCTLTKF